VTPIDQSRRADLLVRVTVPRTFHLPRSPQDAASTAPAADLRYNAFDWETWHELVVLRRELAPRYEAKKP
jgi:hypothetical protein